MRSLPRPAQLYLVMVWLFGLLVAVLAFRYRGPNGDKHLWELPIFLLLAVLAGSKKVQLIRGKAYDEVGSMSLGFAITFATVLRFGPGWGVMVGSLSCLSG